MKFWMWSIIIIAVLVSLSSFIPTTIKDDPEVWTTNDDGSMTVTGHNVRPWWRKINPIWWLCIYEDWFAAPDINNGQPYLPGITNKYLRSFYWFWRNPCSNFISFIIGVSDRNYTVIGTYPVLLTTEYDLIPHGYGWKWSIIKIADLGLPFISYSGTKYLWYFGWRPSSGGFGIKFNIHSG